MLQFGRDRLDLPVDPVAHQLDNGQLFVAQLEHRLAFRPQRDPSGIPAFILTDGGR
ncbi:MAG: hypothetical protein LCH82_06545 [Actinobacteria bacterium]|nr:hypothetical protein [Actinomycetota bacterium]